MSWRLHSTEKCKLIVSENNQTRLELYGQLYRIFWKVMTKCVYNCLQTITSVYTTLINPLFPTWSLDLFSSDYETRTHNTLFSCNPLWFWWLASPKALGGVSATCTSIPPTFDLTFNVGPSHCGRGISPFPKKQEVTAVFSSWAGLCSGAKGKKTIPGGDFKKKNYNNNNNERLLEKCLCLFFDVQTGKEVCLNISRGCVVKHKVEHFMGKNRTFIIILASFAHVISTIEMNT